MMCNCVKFDYNCLYILLIISSSPLFLSPSQITAFDELQADFKVPIDQGNPLHAVGLLSLLIVIHPRHVPLDYCLCVWLAIVGTYGKRFQTILLRGTHYTTAGDSLSLPALSSSLPLTP